MLLPFALGIDLTVAVGGSVVLGIVPMALQRTATDIEVAHDDARALGLAQFV